MEAAVATSMRLPLPLPLPLLPTAGRPLLPSGLVRPLRGFASITATSTFGAGASGGRGGGDDSGVGAAAATAALAALGMTCRGCAAKVKWILESQVQSVR